MTAKPGSELAEPSLKRMAGHAEGIYASSLSTDGESRQTDQGLTLFPKIQSRGSSCLERACTGIEERPRDPSNQLGSVQNDLEERDARSYSASIYETFLRLDPRPSKRRRLTECISENPGLSSRVPVPVTQSSPVSSQCMVWQVLAKQYMQVFVSDALPGSFKVGGKPRQPYGGKENVPNDAAQIASLLQRDKSRMVDVHQKDSGDDGLPRYVKKAAIQGSIVKNEVFIGQRPGPVKAHDSGIRGALDRQIRVIRNNSQTPSNVRKVYRDAATNVITMVRNQQMLRIDSRRVTLGILTYLCHLLKMATKDWKKTIALGIKLAIEFLLL